MTAVFRFAWNARERAYTGNHGQHSYLVRKTLVAGEQPWTLYVDGRPVGHARTHKLLLRQAQQIARTFQEC